MQEKTLQDLLVWVEVCPIPGQKKCGECGKASQKLKWGHLITYL